MDGPVQNLKELRPYKTRKFHLFMVYEHGSELSVGRRNAVTITIRGGPWVKASRIVVRITFLRSFVYHNLSVRPNEVVGFCDFGTLHHSRDF